MTQEVGFVEPRRGKLNFDAYPIGKLLLLIPFHVRRQISLLSFCVSRLHLLDAKADYVDPYVYHIRNDIISM
jgi:hypothetical protein